MKLQLQFWLYVAALIGGLCIGLLGVASFALAVWSFFAGLAGPFVTLLLLALCPLCACFGSWLEQMGKRRLEQRLSKEQERWKKPTTC
jgi:hypothetical protein